MLNRKANIMYLDDRQKFGGKIAYALFKLFHKRDKRTGQ